MQAAEAVGLGLVRSQINSVLDLSRYEHGQTPVRDEPARLLSLVEHVRSRVMPIAMLHAVRVEFEAASRLPARPVVGARRSRSHARATRLTSHRLAAPP